MEWKLHWILRHLNLNFVLFHLEQNYLIHNPLCQKSEWATKNQVATTSPPQADLISFMVQLFSF